MHPLRSESCQKPLSIATYAALHRGSPTLPTSASSRATHRGSARCGRAALRERPPLRPPPSLSLPKAHRAFLLELGRGGGADSKGLLLIGFFLLGFFSLLASARRVDELAQYIFCLGRKHISYISLTSYYSSLSGYVCISPCYNSPCASLVG